MPTLTELRDRRNTAWAQMRALLETADAEGRDLTAEERASYEAGEAEIDRTGSEIELRERHDARAAALDAVDRSAVPAPRAAPDDAEARYAAAFSGWLHAGMDALDAEQRSLLRARFVADPEVRAAGVGSGAAGGYAVPPEFRATILEQLKDFGPMLRLAETVETATGANLAWPTNDDTSNVGAILAENTQVGEQDVALGTASLDAYMYTSKLVRASYQLLNDVPGFDAWLARKLGERIGRILNAHCTVGTGTGQPDGIVTSATVGATGTGSFATTGGISYGDLVDVVESLDPAYGSGSGLTWMVHQSARRAMRKLLDGQGRPLWEPTVQAGAPDTLLGYPVVVNNDMPALAVGSKSVLFGNVREAYVIRIVTDTTVVRLAERYADYLQQAFIAFKRADGTMQNASAVRVFQTTSTA